MVLEQPSSSLMGQTTWMRFLHFIRSVSSISFHMGAYNHDVPKLTVLWFWSGVEWPEGLEKEMSEADKIRTKKRRHQG